MLLEELYAASPVAVYAAANALAFNRGDFWDAFGSTTKAPTALLDSCHGNGLI